MLTAIGFLLRVFSYLYHLILALFLLGISSVAMSSGTTLKLGMLPWDGNKLNDWALGLGVFGLICVVLAVTGILRFLFPLWTLLAFVLMFRGFFLTMYSFGTEISFRSAVWLTLGALLAFVGSLSVLKRRPYRR